MKVVQKQKKCNVWLWKLYALKLNNKKWDYAMVSKTWNIAQVEGTITFAIDSFWNTVLIKTYRHAIDKYSIECVRWTLEPNIYVEENALKEFQEETGIKKQPLKITVLSNNYSADGGIIWGLNSIVLLEFDNLETCSVYWKQDGRNEGIVDVMLVSLEELEQMIKTGEVFDGFTISTYGLLKAYGYI